MGHPTMSAESQHEHNHKAAMRWFILAVALLLDPAAVTLLLGGGVPALVECFAHRVVTDLPALFGPCLAIESENHWDLHPQGLPTDGRSITSLFDSLSTATSAISNV
jgi:hypothetical protein